MRRPRRYRPIAVVDRRTYRNAAHDVVQLASEGEWLKAHAGAHAICQWLAYESRTGRRSRRAQYAADLTMWRARAAEYNPLAGLW